MFMTDVNNVKIYNLSVGKSLPDWLTDRKRRQILQKNVDLRKRIELIQDFDMPDECNTICMSPDYQYIIATGTYKPRVKCFEVNNLSTKFERCFDSEVVCCKVISEDYSKMVFLQSDRFIEIHAAHGRHYRLRIPRFGYDMSYHIPTCDLFVVGASNEIYRLNFERGQFMQPFETEATSNSVNACDINSAHHLLCVGTRDGRIEAWDPRDKKRCAILDVAMKITNFTNFPSITTIKFKNSLQMGIGTQSGHVLLYDIRSREPLLIKDHSNRLPVKKIDFNPNHNLVYSLDSSMLKIWDESNGKQTAYIESEYNFHDFCTIPNTGMFFFAQEYVKMLTYYIPSFGPAPRWCSFLDNLTEALETENIEHIYDDYHFVTRQELKELELEHLEGSNLLRAHMHGFFIDNRLYKKARQANAPFKYDKYREEKITKQIEASRPNRLQIKSNLPKVNQEIALKLMDDKENTKKSRRNKKIQMNLLDDARFKAMFENPEFEIDKNADEYKMLTPVLSRLDKSRIKELKRKAVEQQQQAVIDELHNDNESVKSSDDDLFSEKDDDADVASTADDNDSSDDDHTWTQEVKKQYKEIRKRRKMEESEDDVVEQPISHASESKMIPINELDYNNKRVKRKIDKTSLADRLAKQSENVTTIGELGNKQIVFNTGTYDKAARKRELQLQKHREERRKVIRSTSTLKLKKYILPSSRFNRSQR